MHPTLLDTDFAGLSLHLAAYSTMMVLAWIVALTAITVTAGRAGLPRFRVLLIYVGVLSAGVTGARLLHAATNLDLYRADPALLWSLDAAGFALYGGLVTGALTGLALALVIRLPVWRLADIGGVGLGLGIAIYRVGCFLQGCCYGRPTDLPWGVRFPPGSPAWARQMMEGDPSVSGDGLLSNILGAGAIPVNHPVHPTQLYELLAALAAVGLVALLWRRGTPQGVPFLGAALWFTAFRIVNAQIRWTPATLTAPSWFYPVFYAALMALFVCLLVIRLRPHDDATVTAGRPAHCA